MENVFDDNKLVSLSCGEYMSGLAMQSGTVYTWGKGEHEKLKFNDYMEYSSPFAILEQKTIEHLSFGRSHVMALDSQGMLYAWGDGQYGCLGFGDNKKRSSPTLLPFFDQQFGKKVIDVSCGNQFTVVICQVDELGEPG